MTKILSKSQIAFLTTILMLIIPITAYGTDGQIKLTQPVAPDTFPIVINKAGSYVLTSNLVVTDPDMNAITIEVNDVTLDLNGHKIQGPNLNTGQGYGIYSADHYSITIKNGRIWGFARDGVYCLGAPPLDGLGTIVKDMQFANNDRGIFFGGGTIINCTANNNAHEGISARYSTVTNCIANRNGYYGIAANHSTVTDCTASNNGNTGISAIAASTISNCTVSYNLYGILALQSSIVKGCNVRNNVSAGIDFGSPPVSQPTNYIYGNAIGQNGVAFSCPTGNVCTDNAIW